MHHLLSPRTARHARLFRLAQSLAASPNPPAGVPKTDGERLMWVNSHVKRNKDIELSHEEEQLRERQMPIEVGENSFASTAEVTHGNLFHFREYPMYPGEYVPAEHKALSSLRDELRLELTAQSLKEAWMRVSGGVYFQSVEDYYASVDGIDAEQLGEVLAALFPDLSVYEAQALVQCTLESISKPMNTAARQLSRTITADAVGLDNAPGHYTNFLEWMGRLTETRAFKTEHALFQFSRRKFNREDVRVMFENYKLMSKATLQSDSADSYSHFHTVLRDFARKVAGEDSRHQIGVRIDEPEVDPETGIAVGRGCADGEKYQFIALLRENRDHNGSITVMGKPLSLVLDSKAWLMELVLMPFDEAALDYRDFDVHIVSEGHAMPSIANEIAAFALRMSVANALVKLLPLTRIPLKKSGLLSVDRRRERGQFPGYLDGKKVKRKFAKR
ncbi:Ribosomal protein S9 [Trypanosoma melophagium]|uniref:Ribosomal protein S9 n=1 Tax=Trypanosoma melophagium TaxID=715481 RepID=UPI00351A60F6|nr:Ribosomal protein S9 [Trypanosoma melophagium]